MAVGSVSTGSMLCTGESLLAKMNRKLVKERAERDTLRKRYLRALWILDETTATAGEAL